VQGNQVYVTNTHSPEAGEFTCPICGKPINLTQDRYADENGKAMHEGCYVQRLMASRNDPPDPRHTE
jgi:hypothetical protein